MKSIRPAIAGRLDTPAIGCSGALLLSLVFEMEIKYDDDDDDDDDVMLLCFLSAVRSAENCTGGLFTILI